MRTHPCKSGPQTLFGVPKHFLGGPQNFISVTFLPSFTHRTVYNLCAIWFWVISAPLIMTATLTIAVIIVDSPWPLAMGQALYSVHSPCFRTSRPPSEMVTTSPSFYSPGNSGTKTNNFPTVPRGPKFTHIVDSIKILMKNVSPVKWDTVLEEMLINDKSRWVLNTHHCKWTRTPSSPSLRDFHPDGVSSPQRYPPLFATRPPAWV